MGVDIELSDNGWSSRPPAFCPGGRTLMTRAPRFRYRRRVSAAIRGKVLTAGRGRHARWRSLEQEDETTAKGLDCATGSGRDWRTGLSELRRGADHSRIRRSPCRPIRAAVRLHPSTAARIEQVFTVPVALESVNRTAMPWKERSLSANVRRLGAATGFLSVSTPSLSGRSGPIEPGCVVHGPSRIHKRADGG